MRQLQLAIVLLFPFLVSSTVIKCYKGLKYMIGQDIFQDTEDCDTMFGLGDSYCYSFYEETGIQEVTKLGCSNIICNGIRNTCAEGGIGQMKGKLCCCNDRHYCNSARLTPFLIPVFLFLFVVIEVILYLP